MTRKIIFALISLAIFVNLCSTVSAYDVSITVPNVVNEGETISFSYVISSNTEEKIIFMPYVECMIGPGDFLIEKTVTISSDNLYEGTHTFTSVDYESFENSYCMASLMIIEPDKRTFTETFEIQVADHLDATTDSYAPKETRNKKVFILGETAQIKNMAKTNTGENADVSFISEVKLNGKKVAEFNEETFESKLLYAGSYEVRVTASAPGFKSALAVTRFTVAEKHVTPKSVEYSCNLDGECQPEEWETIEFCPEDCLPHTDVIASDNINGDSISGTPVQKYSCNLDGECQPEEGETIEFCPEDCLPHTDVIASDNIDSGSVTGIPMQVGSMGNAICLFDGVCIGNFNIAIIVFSVVVIAGFLFLRKRSKAVK